MSTSPGSESGTRRLSPRQSERRRKILTAAQAMLARHGYDGVSMRMIAEEAGVAERTLFNIHSGKAALIAASARERSDDIISEAWDTAPDPGTGFLLTMCATLARYTLADPDMARSYAPVLIQHADLIGLHEVYRVRAPGTTHAARGRPHPVAPCRRRAFRLGPRSSARVRRVDGLEPPDLSNIAVHCESGP